MKISGRVFFSKSKQHMKKFLLFVACLSGTAAFAQYEEGFEDYTAGDYICVESDLFDIWPGGWPGGIYDSQVDDSLAFEGVNSLKIEAQNVTGGPMDVLLNVGKSEGNWSLDWEMLIPTGHSAYFNVQGTDVAGAETDSWQCNFFAATDGSAIADGPWGTSAPTAVPHDEWFNVRFVVDLDQELFKMWLNGEEVFQAAYNGNFSSINFYALGDGQTIGFYYLDSITLAESDVVLVDVEENVARAFGFHPNPTNGQLRLTGVLAQTNLVVLDLMGREVLSETLDAGQQNIQLDLPEGVYLIGTDNQQNLRKLVIRR